MTKSPTQMQLLAFAVYEIRLLLAGHLGAANESELPTRVAAHLSYALHNQALSALKGEPFNVEQAVASIEAAGKVLGVDFSKRISQVLAEEG